MEYTKQDIQDTTTNYLVNTPTPDTNILNNVDDTIKYIKEFLQPHHYYPESPTNQDNITPDIRAEARDITAANANASTHNTIRPTAPL